MYHLTLTKEERAAFDWVGNRYATGYNVYRLLWLECCPTNAEWEGDYDITFKVAEATAWQIKEHSDEEGDLWPCFSDELAAKLRAFCDAIV